METKTNPILNEETKTKISQLNKSVEELENQLKLVEEESLNELEKQKENFKNVINEIKLNIEKSFPKEKIDKFQAFIDELYLQLALGKVETRDLLEDQKKNLFKTINSIKLFLTHDISISNPEFETYLFKFNHEVLRLESTIDIFRLKFALGKAEFKYEYQKNKIEFFKKINEIKLEIEHDVEKAEQKINDLKEEVKNVINGFLEGLKK